MKIFLRLTWIFFLFVLGSSVAAPQERIVHRVRRLPDCTAALPTGTACIWQGGSGYLYDDRTGRPSHIYAVLVDPVGLPEYESTTENVLTTGWAIQVIFGDTCDTGHSTSGYGVIDHCVE
jgi:hypothetical protein